MATDFPPKPQNADKAELDDPVVRASIRAGHETTDVSVPGLYAFVAGFGLTIAAILIGLVVLFKGFGFVNHRLNERIARQEPGAASRVHVQPDYQGPLLQVKPEEDLRWMRNSDTAALDSYDWVDRSAGVVRVPIDRAMDLIAERGLPPVSPNHTLEELQRMRAQPQVYGQSLRP